jgi:hypothetical protein
MRSTHGLMRARHTGAASVHPLLTTDVLQLSRFGAMARKLLLTKVMRINNDAQASAVLSPGLPDLSFSGPLKMILWRPRCTDLSVQL